MVHVMKQLPRFVRFLLIGFGAVILSVAFALWVVVIQESEISSRHWTAASSADAAARKLLRARPAVTPPTFEYLGQSITVGDAWVEQVTHVSYGLYLFRRTVQDPYYRLVVKGVPSAERETVTAGEHLVYADSLCLGSMTGSVFFNEDLQPPFPDTVRLRVLPPSEPCIGQQAPHPVR